MKDKKWTIQDEYRFIDRMGNERKLGWTSHDRLRLLKTYRQNTVLRSQWDGMNVDLIVKYLDLAIEQMEETLNVINIKVAAKKRRRLIKVDK